MRLRLRTPVSSNYRRHGSPDQQEPTVRTLPMTVVRRVARPMLAAMFVVGGLDQLKHPGAKAATARPIVERVGPRLGLGDDTEMLVRANGVAMVAAGTLLAFGRLPRIASTVLAATLVPT